MEQSSSGGTASLEEFTDALRRRWWVVFVFALLGIGMAGAYLMVAPKTYVSTAAVLVSPVGGVGDNVVDGARTNSLINLDTEAQLVTSQTVSQIAKDTLKSPELVGQLVQRVSVEVPPNTNVLRISYTGGSPNAAALGADAYAHAYLTNRQNLALAENQAQVNSLQKQIVDLTKVWNAASTKPDKDLALSDLTAVKARLNALIGTAVIPGEVISTPLAPHRAASPNRTFTVMSGMAMGVLIGLVAVALLEYRDGRFHDWRVVERRLGLPVLANIPVSRKQKAQLFSPHSMPGQSFIELRTALSSGLTCDHHVVLIASPTRGHGADLVVANLAAATARANLTTTVLVVDDSSHVTDVLGLPLGDGLSDVLAGTATLSEVGQSVQDIPGLTVVAAGRDLHERIDDLEGAGILPVIKTLNERNNYVFILAAPQSESADAQFLGYHAEVAIPVVELAKVRRTAVALAVREWELVGTPVPGAVTLPAVAEPEPWPPPVRNNGRKTKKR